jgi:hypothetical protein
LVALLGQVCLWEAAEQAAADAAVAAQQAAPKPAAVDLVEQPAPVDPLEDQPLDPQEARRRLIAMQQYGATPHRLAARVGVSSEKLLRQEAAIRKRMRRTLSPAEAREMLRRHEPVLGFLALSDLVPVAKLERGIQELALEALARREALTRGQPPAAA